MTVECDKQRSSLCNHSPRPPRSAVRAEADRLRALKFDHELPSRTPIHERLHLTSEKARAYVSGQLTDDPLVAHRGFSRARRSTSARISSEIAGRPGRRPAYVHRFRTSWRCQPSNVSGRMKNDGRLALLSSWLAAARNTRSLSFSRGRATWRRRTASSWRSTTISSSLYSRERNRSAATASTRRNSRYTATIRPSSSLLDPNPKKTTLRS